MVTSLKQPSWAQGVKGESPVCWGQREEANGPQSQEGTFLLEDPSLWLQPPPAASHGKARRQNQMARGRGTNTKQRDATKEGDPGNPRAGPGLRLPTSYRPGH